MKQETEREVENMTKLKGLKQYKKYYEDKYDDKMSQCVKQTLLERRNAKFLVDSIESALQETFEETCDVEEAVGYYIKTYKEEAYKVWEKRTPLELEYEENKKVGEILKELYEVQHSTTYKITERQYAEYQKLKQKECAVAPVYDIRDNKYRCPVCNYVVNYGVPKQRYCDGCGQRLI